MSDTKLNYIQIGDQTYNIGGSGGSTGGYPVVTVKDNFNIEAEPNTFYNIKNNADSQINITFGEDFYVDSRRKHIMFAGDVTSSSTDDMILQLFKLFGGVLVDDTSVDGYKYRMDFNLTALSGGQMSGIFPVYLSDEIKTGSSVSYYAKQNASLNIPEDITATIDNIVVFTDNVDYLITINYQGVGYPHVLIEVENDKEEYQHAYTVKGMFQDWESLIYTTEPYYLASDFYTDDGTNLADYYTFSIQPNIDHIGSDIANEFVFNINSPANIIFNNDIKWNNGNIPDLTQFGVYTISILNGVGCYTFV